MQTPETPDRTRTYAWEDQVGYASVDLTVTFLRPVTVQTGLVTAVGRVTHSGSRTSLAEATLSDGRGRLLATAISTCMTLD